MEQFAHEHKKTLHELNRQHLAALERDGSDLNSAHTTCHHFEMADDSGVGILRSLLLASGFHVNKVIRLQSGELPSLAFSWKIEAELKMIPMLPSLHAMTDYCCDLARMADGQYRGWYAQAVRKT